MRKRFSRSKTIVHVHRDHSAVGVTDDGHGANVVHLLRRDISIGKKLPSCEMHHISSLVGTCQPLDAFHELTKDVVDQIEVRTTDPGESADEGGGEEKCRCNEQNYTGNDD